MSQKKIGVLRRLKSQEEVKWTKFQTISVDPKVMEAQGLLGIMVNSLYTVVARHTQSFAFKDENNEMLSMVHLAIKKNVAEGEVVDGYLSWEDKQRIKNEIVGEDVESFELYPAENRCMRDLNEHHLWCLPEGVKIPVGFVPKELRVVHDEVDEKGNPVVRRMTPDEIVEDDERQEDEAKAELDKIREEEIAKRKEEK